MITEVDIETPPDVNLELFNAIGDAIVADAGIQIVEDEPKDHEYVGKKINKRPRILQRPVSLQQH